MHQITRPTKVPPGLDRENAFSVLDETGMRLGSAMVIEYVNQAVLPDRPLNYYVTIDALDSRSFDMLLGAVLARSLYLRRQQPGFPARIYIPCRPNDSETMRNLQLFGFQNDDAEIRMRRILSPGDAAPMPPVGTTITPVLMETEQDCDGLLQRVNRMAVSSMSARWLDTLRGEPMFTVFGVWQEQRLLGELILTSHGAEGRIAFVYTQPAYRGRGIGKALVAHACGALQRSGIRIVNTEVWRRNTAAMALFQSMHFDSISPTLLYPGINLA